MHLLVVRKYDRVMREKKKPIVPISTILKQSETLQLQAVNMDSEAFLNPVRESSTETFPKVLSMLEFASRVGLGPNNFGLATACYVLLYYVAIAAAFWCFGKAVQDSGIAESTLCSFRAIAFLMVYCLCLGLDFFYIITSLQNKKLPLPRKKEERRMVLQATKKSMLTNAVNPFFLAITVLLPVALWLHSSSISVLAGSVILFFVAVLHNFADSISVTFLGTYANTIQVNFLTKLKLGEYNFEEAVSKYRDLNAMRKVIAKQLLRGTPAIALFVLFQVVLMYDLQVKNWAQNGWLILLFLLSAIGFVHVFEPFLCLSGYEKDLILGVWESKELTWSSHERNLFAQHVQFTKFSVKILNLEVGPAFRTAYPFLLYTWWLSIEKVHASVVSYDLCGKNIINGTNV